jgi:hypothetical protein
MVGSWVFQKNVETFIEMLAWIAGAPFEEWEYHCDKVTKGLEGTSDELDVWFDYELRGKKRSLTFQAADDPGSSVYHFRVNASSDAVELVELAFHIGAESELPRMWYR